MTLIRVGVLGHGGIGRRLVERLMEDPRFAVAFVHNRSQETMSDLPQDLVLDDLDRAGDRGATVVVEAAHPALTRSHGLRLLRHADYMPLSASVLADDDLRAALVGVAEKSGHRLLVPRGALVGLDTLVAGRGSWARVRITFTKNPAGIENADGARPQVDGRTTLFDGTARVIAARFPRNVNAMVTLALATVGLDRCETRLVADPAATAGRLEIEAVGHDGSVLRISREQPMAGVSGTEMLDSVWRSLEIATTSAPPGLTFT